MPFVEEILIQYVMHCLLLQPQLLIYIYTYVYICTYAGMYRCTSVKLLIYIYTHVYTYAHTQVCIDVHLSLSIYYGSYTYRDIRTHTHTHCPTAAGLQEKQHDCCGEHAAQPLARPARLGQRVPQTLNQKPQNLNLNLLSAEFDMWALSSHLIFKCDRRIPSWGSILRAHGP